MAFRFRSKPEGGEGYNLKRFSKATKHYTQNTFESYLVQYINYLQEVEGVEGLKGFTHIQVKGSRGSTFEKQSLLFYHLHQRSVSKSANFEMIM